MNSPKKALGQHWLFDEAALAAVVEAGEVGKDDTVLEIGPGLGSLTSHLVEAASRVVAVETDSELAQGLTVRVPADNLEVIEADILAFDTTTLPDNYKVVANIPYYLTSKILRYFLEAPKPPEIMSLLMQQEVAERITAEPGDMSILAFSVQYYAEVEICGYVAKELFEPVPEVDSAIARLRLRKTPYFEADTKQLFQLVKAGFGERRKKLTNSLAGGLQLDKAVAADLLKQAGINADARAQELSIEEWRELYTLHQRSFAS